MSKRLILILTLAFVVGISFAAFAEVQNVKVSGDITIGGVYRNNFDLAKTPTAVLINANDSGNKQSIYSDKEADFLTITRVRVDADLTDNVAVCVRLLNERNWNGESNANLSENNRNIGLNTVNAQEEDEITLDLAYITLKEFLYSPLTVTAGRQEMRFGNGWIVGDPDTNGYALRSALAEGDLSARKSFDAFRATLDYNPLVVDMIFAKIAENNTVLNDDITLSGINANYALDKNTTIEGFFFSKITGTNAAAATNLDLPAPAALAGTFADFNKADKVFTVGSRVVNKTVKNLTIDAQAAYQFGSYNPKFDPNALIVNQGVGLNQDNAGQGIRKAWGLEAMATYDLKDIQKIAKYKPAISAAYVYLSGEARDRGGDKAYGGWDPMFEDQTFGHIINAVMKFTNTSLTGLSLQAKPMDDITAKLDYVTAWFNKGYSDQTLAELSGVSNSRNFNMGKSKHIGQEIDLTLTYDYTEDVQFSLLSGILLTGKSINPGRNINSLATGVPGMAHDLNRATATEVVGTMKVTF